MANPWDQFAVAEDKAALDANPWAQFAPAPEQATLTAYEPTIRDRIAAALMPDDPRESPVQARLVESIVGSRGLGRSGPGGLGGIADFVPPVGVLFAGDEASKAAQKGDFTGAALHSLGVVGPAAQAIRAAVPALESAAPKLLLPPAGPAVPIADEAVAAGQRFGNLLNKADEVATAAPVQTVTQVTAPAPAQAPRAFGGLIRNPADEAAAIAGGNAEQVAVGAAKEAPAATGTPVGAAPAVAAKGDAVRIVTPDSTMEIAARPQIVELDSLKAAQGKFQPRDRTRAEYVQEARERASRLDPAQLGVSRVSDSGAPIILDDGTIISGNGRTMSIQEAYSNPALASQAQAYKASLGPEAAGMRQPVLVMRAEGLTGDDAVKFADLSNRGRIAAMSATERAQRDASSLGDRITLYQGGDFEAPQNAEFLRSFMENVATRSERAALSKDGFLRNL